MLQATLVVLTPGMGKDLVRDTEAATAIPVSATRIRLTDQVRGRS